MSRYDAIIIGGGPNGLTAAARLARAGRRVLLLERSPMLGGQAVGDTFHEGFTSVGPVHDTGELRPHVVDALALADHGLRRATQPAPIFLPDAPDEGPGLLLAHDPAQAAAEIAAHASSDVDAYARYRGLLGRVGPVLRDLLDHEPPSITGFPSLAALGSIASRGLAVRRLGRADMMELLRIAPMCVADWLNEHFENESLSCALALPALTATTTGPWSPGTVANLLRVEALAGPPVVGGPVAAIEAIVAAARAAGAELRTESEVATINADADGVSGVTLTDGTRVDATIIAAACDPRHAFLDLLSPAAITPKLHRQIEVIRARGTTAQVDLAIRGSLRFACRPDLDVERARIVTTIDDMERSFDSIKYGRASERPVLDVVVPTVANPALAPDDHAVVTIVGHYAPFDLRDGWTDAARGALGDRVIETLSRCAPDLPGQIIAQRVRTPVDLAARYGTPQGHLHHVEHALDQMIVRPAPACARYASPIPGLYLCGSGSHPGGGLTGGPGVLAATMIANAR